MEVLINLVRIINSPFIVPCELQSFVPKISDYKSYWNLILDREWFNSLFLYVVYMSTTNFYTHAIFLH